MYRLNVEISEMLLMVFCNVMVCVVFFLMLKMIGLVILLSRFVFSILLSLMFNIVMLFCVEGLLLM